MDKQIDLVESITKKLQGTGKIIKLKASEKAAEELVNTGLVGKLLLDRVINKSVIKAIILKAWRTSRSVQIVDLKENIFLFKFACEGDRKRILELGPCYFEGCPIILKMWHQNLSVKDMDFSSIPIWMQVHNLPIEYMSKENAKELGALVGEVIEVDFTGNRGICMSKFIRVRVELKVDNPLWSGFFLDRQPQSDLWIHFKYERIADICYKCGRLGHLKARCSWVDHSGKQLNPKEPFGFGPWMKAENMSRRSTRWVEFLHEADQSRDEEEGDEEERGRQWQVESDGSREHAPGGARIKVQLDISFLAKVDGSEKCQTNFENSEAHIPSKQLSAEKFPAYYNEGEKSGPSDSSMRVAIAKRKFEEEENNVTGRALKLTKVGSGLLNVQSKLNVPRQPIPKEFSRRTRMDKKKRIKELAREQSTVASNSPLQEMTCSYLLKQMKKILRALKLVWKYLLDGQGRKLIC
ncbi:uncharacterized protein CFP56_026224 [Quercus suber]|uniref:CCHC-type domain-containing protein n=1 Tax=Quercus suber TaxID=58331 RepID=A0AAW0K2S5_QUESU